MTIQIIENERCCRNCRFYEEGDCKRYPPQLGVDPNCEHTGNVFYCFPSVDKEDWCGEFQAIERWVIPEGFVLVDPHAKKEESNAQTNH